MRKYLYLISFSLLLVNCSSDSGGTVEPPKPIVKKPVAVDDSFDAVEDLALVISTMMSNDKDATKARITTIDATSTNNGTIEDNRDGTYTYKPAAQFLGTDTFKYTICDSETPKNCSTATVTITVIDEGSPVAVDDSYSSTKNITRTFTNLLDNDDLTDDATITSVDNSGSSGTATLNDDGSITYVPQSDFIGEDTFTYSICDDDTPMATCATATVTISILESVAFNIPAEIASYYENLGLTTDADLNHELISDFTTAKHTTILSYGQRHDYLYDADEDKDNKENVILMYSGESRYWKEYTSGSNTHSPQTFNTEHIYPQSKLDAKDSKTDLHHLRACDASVNSNRSNHPFMDGSGTYKSENDKWYPGDDWRGDVARMIMYLNIRYGETFEKVGTLELFLKWNKDDPVSDFEIQRNAIFESAQGNRNPFIDNPYIATLIWGGSDAENKWE